MIENERKRKKMKEMKNGENDEKRMKNEEICIHTQNPRRFPGFSVVVVIFSSKSSTISMILFRNVSLSRGKSTTRFGRSPFFRRKVTIFSGRETQIHTHPKKIDEKIDKVSRSNNNYSFRIV